MIPLWSDSFLGDDICRLTEYVDIRNESASFDAFLAASRKHISTLRSFSNPDEEITIERAVMPILRSLGWPTALPKRSLTNRDEVDLAIFAEANNAELLLSQSERQQVLQSNGIVECKRWNRDFDAPGSGSRKGETAAQQIQRYLLNAGTDSGESLRWSMLTNGGRWRIYSYRARPRDRAWEIDLEKLLVPKDLFGQVLDETQLHQLRTAYLLLRRDSWVPVDGRRESLLDKLLASGQRRDAIVANDLSNVIFEDIFPKIVRLFWNKQPSASSDIVARTALTFLYRLLFIYYAEDRGLLNAEDPKYRPHSLRYSVRDPVAQQYGIAEFSTISTQLWQRLNTVCKIIDQGDQAIGQPAFNGGLFAPIHAILDEVDLSDAEMAPIIYRLSHTTNGTYISYRSLEVQQLGSIYERLLERIPHRTSASEIEITISPFARKESGSYYTPQELVDLIVESTLAPLVEDCVNAFRDEPVTENDPAKAVLDLKVLDPAMGSGHFLITAIDWLTECVAGLIEREWEEFRDYVSPVRRQLWEIQDRFPGLGDQALLRRMVLKRCIFGVDKNPMAVELAKVGLWLHTFTGRSPLPYLENQVVNGDSLLGVRGLDAQQYISSWGKYPLGNSLENDCMRAAGPANEARQLLDLTTDEITESEQLHDATRQFVARHRHQLDLVAGFRWLSAGMNKRDLRAFHTPLVDLLAGHPGRAVSILLNGENREGLTPATPDYRNIRDAAIAVATRERTLHWEIEFPHVLLGGGFDAVISNPPWEQIKLDEIEWWQLRDQAVTHAETTVERNRLIQRHKHANPTHFAAFEESKRRARNSIAYFGASQDFRFFGRGDTNLYGLFFERSLALLNPRGIAGLLVPSGIFADKSSEQFTRAVTKSRRIAILYDFENRRRDTDQHSRDAQHRWFASVHPQQRFCSLIVGGPDRQFAETSYGFMLSGKDEFKDPDRVFSLATSACEQINPNTHQIPQMRTRREAELILRLHRDNRVLVDRSGGSIKQVWPVRYKQGYFHSKRDASLFSTADFLERMGAYPVDYKRYRKGNATWAPLYQGRMISQFNHRENSIGFNPKNTKRPYVSIKVSDSDRQNSRFFADPRHWIPTDELNRRVSGNHEWVVGFRDVTSATNERTVIATVMPYVGVGDTIGLLLDDGGFDASSAACLIANLNSMVCDFVAGRKISSSHVKKFMIEQLPMISPTGLGRRFGNVTAKNLIRDHVLRLVYTAADLSAFAIDLGFQGKPFTWNSQVRLQLRARLDALFFHLYGLDEQETSYVIDQFPVLAKRDLKQYGQFLSKHLILNQYRALASGDVTSEIAV